MLSSRWKLFHEIKVTVKKTSLRHIDYSVYTQPHLLSAPNYWYLIVFRIAVYVSMQLYTGLLLHIDSANFIRRF